MLMGILLATDRMGDVQNFEIYARARCIAPIDVAAISGINPLLHMINHSLQACVTYYQKQNPRISGLILGFSESKNFGASADIWNEQCVINIQGSVPTVIYNLFNTIYSHTTTINAYKSMAIVDPTGVRSNENELKTFLFNGGRLFERNIVSSESCFLITQVLCDFIFFHELVHLANGHVDLFQSVMGMTSMDELSDSVSDRLTAIDFQTMEWDADQSAYILAGRIIFHRLIKKNISECSVAEKLHAFRSYHIGLYLLFKIVEFWEPNLPTHKRKHPTPVVRISFLFEAMSRLSDRLDITPSDNFFGDIVETGEVAWSLVAGLDAAHIGKQLNRMAAQIDDGGVIMENWNQLRERLIPFNRGSGDLAPAIPEA